MLSIKCLCKKAEFLFFVFSLLLVSCSKDYRSCIPAGCQALMAVDVLAIGRESGLDKSDEKQDALKTLLMTDDIADCGIDVTERLYCFETADGEFGIVAKVGSKSKVGGWIENLSTKGVCKKVGEKKGYDFYTLKESFLVTYSGNALMIMGPFVADDMSRKQVQMAKWLDASDGEGMMQSKIFERLEQMNGSVSLVARSSALPEKFVTPVILGAPKGTDASEVLVSADMNVSRGILNVAGDVFSFNVSVDETLKKSAECYRPITGTYLDRISVDNSAVLITNVDGAGYLKLLRTNDALRTMLLGINTAIDMDKMLTTIDGDMMVCVPNLLADRISLNLIARVKNTNWVGDVDYWKKSCPAGTAITNVPDASGFPQFRLSGSSTNAVFGMADANTLFVSTAAAEAKDGITTTVAMPAKKLPSDIQAMAKGKRMCIIVNLAEIVKNKKEASLITDMLSSVFGDVSTLVYTVE